MLRTLRFKAYFLPPITFVLWFFQASGLICPANRVSFIRTGNFTSTLKSRGYNVTLTKDNSDMFRYVCHERCNISSACTGYYIDHDNKFCHVILNEDSPNPEQESLVRMGTFFEKICLSESPPCSFQWTAERQISAIPLADRPGDRLLANQTSELSCLEACFTEKSFYCRSSHFDDVTRTCTLSMYDKRSTPGATSHATGSHSISYLENRCVPEPMNCSFDLIRDPQGINPMVVATSSAMSFKYCQLLCRQEKSFWCRSIFYDSSRNVCALSPDGITDFSMKLDPTNKQHKIKEIFKHDSRSHWYLRTDCMDVSMRCNLTTMTTIVTVSSPFFGKMYSLTEPSHCIAQVSPHSNQLVLEMPLEGSPCGTVASGNGTFSNSIVIQSHPNILRSTDRRVDVACDYQKHQMRLRSGKQIVDQDIGNVTVVKGEVPSPEVRLQIVNATGHVVDNVVIGSDLFLQVNLLDERIYGIFGSSLVAKSGDGSEILPLLDSRGCPVDNKIFPALELMPGSKTLHAHFHAFRFSSDVTVRFQMVLDFCLDICPPVKCMDSLGDPALSYGRKKRSHDLLPQLDKVLSAIRMESSLTVVETDEESENLQGLNSDADKMLTTGLPKTICTTPVVVALLGLILGVIQCFILLSCICVISLRKLPSKTPGTT